MTIVTIQNGPDGVAAISAKNHAGYAETGEDIVCSAVSALTLTAAIAVEKLGGRALVRQQPALAEVSLKATMGDNAWAEGAIVLGAIAEGLRAIQREYSDYLTIREV